ncbi:MAG: hypothetical protein ACTHM1_10405 [Solirubrobacteraceae bacterium]
MSLTYDLRDCEQQQQAFCDAMASALPDSVTMTMQRAVLGRKVACLHFRGSGDLYSVVVDALRTSVPHELWSVVSAHTMTRDTANSVTWRPVI